MAYWSKECDGGKTEIHGGKRTRVPHFSPEIPHYQLIGEFYLWNVCVEKSQVENNRLTAK
jgi:hypothetical protein